MHVTIAKQFTFDAAHHLPTMPDGHKCRRHHGHTYEVELVLRGVVHTRPGILIDYAEIAVAWAPVHEVLDHHNLNEIPGLEVPTTENLVAWVLRWFYERARRGEAEWTKDGEAFWDLLHLVRIKESATTWCEMSKVEFLAFCGEMS